ncbi:MAG: HAMP domain-containing histidine kinase [Pirellulales bacterium]|nr:HAMP domain-containing histidine kinase [Pirellulales bacterium]
MRFEQFKHIYRSLRFRLTLWNSAVVLLTAIASLVALREGLRVTLLSETDQQLRGDAQEIKLTIERLDLSQKQIIGELERKAEGHKAQNMFVRLIGPNEENAWTTDGAPNLELPSVASSGAARMMTIDNYRLASESVHLPSGSEYRVWIGKSLDFIEQDVSRLTGIIVLVGGFILVLSPLGGYWLAGRATRPLADMHRTAAALRPDRMNERLPIRGSGDELDRLSDTINGLLDRIAAYIDRHRQFLANAAHELRSPLAAVQSSVEVALTAGRTPREYHDLLGEIAEECGALRVLVNQLLTLAEVEMAGTQSPIEAVDLGQVVVRSVEMFRGAAEERGIDLCIDRLDRTLVFGNALRLRQVVNNLIDNALKFNHSGGWVKVEVTSEPDSPMATLRVSDSGPGISAEDLSHIFDRFYRGDKARQRDNPLHGSGLGLSICHAIVTLYGGTIRAGGSPGEGATFIVQLRRAVVESDGRAPTWNAGGGEAEASQSAAH